MFRKILVPIDGSESSMKAVACAAGLGKKCESEILLLHVLYLGDYAPMELSAASKELLASVEEELKNSAKGMFDKAQELIKGYPFKVSTMAEIGHTSEKILEVAQKENCDAIAVGTRGANKLSEVVVGSTTYHIVQHARVPVITVRA